jgi:hypothetical protein
VREKAFESESEREEGGGAARACIDILFFDRVFRIPPLRTRAQDDALVAGDQLSDEDRLLFGDTDGGIPAPAPVAIDAQHAPQLLLPPPSNASVLPNVDHLLVAQQSAADGGGEVPLSAEERRNERVKALINVHHAPVLPFKVLRALRGMPHPAPSLLAARCFTALHTAVLDPAPPCPLSLEAVALSHKAPLEEKAPSISESQEARRGCGCVGRGKRGRL